MGEQVPRPQDEELVALARTASDVDRDMSPWRDWVIRAFNKNLPYDQFITWQIAGDLLPKATIGVILPPT